MKLMLYSNEKQNHNLFNCYVYKLYCYSYVMFDHKN